MNADHENHPAGIEAISVPVVFVGWINA